MNIKTDSLERAAFGAAMIWGVWTLVPVIGACIAAFLIAMQSGIQALKLPAWAWSTSATAFVLCVAITLAMKPAQRGQVIGRLRMAAMIVFVVLIPLGVLSVVLGQIQPSELITPAASMERNLHNAGNALTVGATWICFFVLPLLLAAVSVLQLLNHQGSKLDKLAEATD